MVVRDSWGTKVNNWKPSKIDTENGGYVQPWDRCIRSARRLLGDDSTRDNVWSLAIRNITSDKGGEVMEMEQEMAEEGVPDYDDRYQCFASGRSVFVSYNCYRERSGRIILREAIIKIFGTRNNLQSPIIC